MSHILIFTFVVLQYQKLYIIFQKHFRKFVNPLFSNNEHCRSSSRRSSCKLRFYTECSKIYKVVLLQCQKLYIILQKHFRKLDSTSLLIRRVPIAKIAVSPKWDSIHSALKFSNSLNSNSKNCRSSSRCSSWKVVSIQNDPIFVKSFISSCN